MALFTSTKKDHKVAIFDIGSGSVGAAVAYIPDEDTIPTITKSVRTDIKFRDKLNFNILLLDLYTALAKTAHSLYTSKIGAPDEIHCVLASPWYVSETRVVKISRDRSFVFTEKLANDLIQKEIIALRSLYEKKYGRMESLPEVVETRIMGVSLDGVFFDEPIGRSMKSLEVHIVISLSPNTLLERIRLVLAQNFHHTRVTFSSFILSTYLAVRDKYVAPDSYLLLDIGGEVSDVALITKGILRSSLSFPFGKNKLFKELCHATNSEFRDAKELFGLYSTNMLSSQKRRTLEPIFNKLESDWNQTFRSSIATLPDTFLPHTLFVTVDTDVGNWFVDRIRKDTKSTVVTLEGPEFLTLCNVKNGACDPFLMVEAIGFMRKFKK